MSTRCFDIRVVVNSQFNRIQKGEKAASVLVAFVQPCHRVEVLNACWREAEVPSMDMAACLGCSGLRVQPVDGAAGMESQGRCGSEARSDRLGDGPGGAGGTRRPAASDRRLSHQHQRYRSPAGPVLRGDVALDHLGR